MEKKVLDVEGIKTEVLSMAAQEPDPTGVTIVVIPGRNPMQMQIPSFQKHSAHWFAHPQLCSSTGNPGAIDFYVEFISELHKLCEQRYDIIGGRALPPPK